MEGLKKSKNFADVINGSSLASSSCGALEERDALHYIYDCRAANLGARGGISHIKRLTSSSRPLSLRDCLSHSSLEVLIRVCDGEMWFGERVYMQKNYPHIYDIS